MSLSHRKFLCNRSSLSGCFSVYSIRRCSRFECWIISNGTILVLYIIKILPLVQMLDKVLLVNVSFVPFGRSLSCYPVTYFSLSQPFSTLHCPYVLHPRITHLTIRASNRHVFGKLNLFPFPYFITPKKKRKISFSF